TSGVVQEMGPESHAPRTTGQGNSKVGWRLLRVTLCDRPSARSMKPKATMMATSGTCKNQLVSLSMNRHQPTIRSGKTKMQFSINLATLQTWTLTESGNNR